MLEPDKGYKSAYWDIRRKLESLKQALVLFVSIVSVYAIRIFIYGESEFYKNWIVTWEALDIIVFGVTFLLVAFLVLKLLNRLYPVNE